ncbi:hypothetical protein AB6N24_00190 [Cellulomonas sp. 179-A 4D5 NHS]|uniref:hypothetical protein n=1 Tax=Cellulomonas sp. 179-A 4D5 NHS TaxID=3142378 RepID=UPI00399F2434
MDRRTTRTHQARGLRRVMSPAAGAPSAYPSVEPLDRAMRTPAPPAEGPVT